MTLIEYGTSEASLQSWPNFESAENFYIVTSSVHIVDKDPFEGLVNIFNYHVFIRLFSGDIVELG